MTKPTIHSNGDRPEVLRDGYLSAYHAVNEAGKALQEIAPNGRNYYPQGDSAINNALDEHGDRLSKLRFVAIELMELAEHCDGFCRK